MQHKHLVESVTTFEQSIEAAKFLAGLALEGQDGLGESASTFAQEIVRDAASGEIVGVVALVNEDEVPPSGDGVFQGERRLFLRIPKSISGKRASKPRITATTLRNSKRPLRRKVAKPKG
jgi:hypothetical protein